MTKAESTLGKPIFLLFQTEYKKMFSWMIETGYNLLTTVLFMMLSLFFQKLF